MPAPNDSLHAAAEEGDVDRLNRFLADGAPVNTRDSQGRTPLMYAIHGRHANVVRHLLKWGRGGRRSGDGRDNFPSHGGARRAMRRSCGCSLLVARTPNHGRPFSETSDAPRGRREEGRDADALQNPTPMIRFSTVDSLIEESLQPIPPSPKWTQDAKRRYRERRSGSGDGSARCGHRHDE